MAQTGVSLAVRPRRQISPGSALDLGNALSWVAATAAIAGAVAYPSLEKWSALGYTPEYSYIGNFSSELAVPYEYNSRYDGRRIHARRAHWMNFNFFQKGLAVLPAQLLMIKASRHGLRSKMGVFRLVVALLHSTGLLLLSRYPAGPRGEADGTGRWHALGATLGIVCGNLQHLLNGLAAPAWSSDLYSRVSFVFGAFGLSMVAAFFKVAKLETRGFWQRLTIYPILASDFVTGSTLFMELLHLKTLRDGTS